MDRLGKVLALDIPMKGMILTNCDDEYHSILLTGELFACCCQSRIPNRNKLKPWRWLPLFGELVTDQCLGSLERQVKRCKPNTSNSSFFFFSLFSMNSNHDLCLELTCGLSGRATKPGGKGAVQSITLPLRSFLCRSLAWSPVPTPGAFLFSLPIGSDNSVYHSVTCTQQVSRQISARHETATASVGPGYHGRNLCRQAHKAVLVLEDSWGFQTIKLDAKKRKYAQRQQNNGQKKIKQEKEHKVFDPVVGRRMPSKCGIALEFPSQFSRRKEAADRAAEEWKGGDWVFGLQTAPTVAGHRFYLKWRRHFSSRL